MKKTIIASVIASFICVASIFALIACNSDNLNYTEDHTAANKEGSAALVNTFFEGTLKDPNFVVTCKDNDGEVQFVENVNGTSSYSIFKNGSERYAYKIGEFFYTADIEQEVNDGGKTTKIRNYYCSDNTKQGFFREYEATIKGENKTVTMEDIYNGYYCQFKSMLYGGVNILDYLNEQNGSFDCKSHTERKDGVTTGLLNLTYTTATGTIAIAITSEENLLKTYNVVTTENDSLANKEYTMTFVYGNASVEIPDTDLWDIEAIAIESIVEANCASSLFSRHDSVALTFSYSEDNGENEEGDDESEASADYVYVSEDYRISVYGNSLVITGKDDIWEYFEQDGETEFWYHWFVMSEEEEEEWRDLPLEFAYINAEFTMKETISSIERNEDGTISIQAELSAEDMRELLSDDYPEGKTLKERTVYVVDSQTFEIISSSATVIVDGEEDSVISIIPSYDVEIPDNLNAILTAINGFKNSEKVESRKIKIIYDYGTDEEETYEIVADSRYRVIPNLREGYVLYADPDKTELYARNDNLDDVTIYAFVETAS